MYYMQKKALVLLGCINLLGVSDSQGTNNRLPVTIGFLASLPYGVRAKIMQEFMAQVQKRCGKTEPFTLPLYHAERAGTVVARTEGNAHFSTSKDESCRCVFTISRHTIVKYTNEGEPKELKEGVDTIRERMNHASPYAPALEWDPSAAYSFQKKSDKYTSCGAQASDVDSSTVQTSDYLTCQTTIDANTLFGILNRIRHAEQAAE